MGMWRMVNQVGRPGVIMTGGRSVRVEATGEGGAVMVSTCGQSV